MPTPAANRIDIDALRRLAGEGVVAATIALQLGCNPSTVYRGARKHGIALPIHPSNQQSARAFWHAHDADLAQKVAMGWRAAKIAEALGTTRGSVIGRALRLRLRWPAWRPVRPKPPPPETSFRDDERAVRDHGSPGQVYRPATASVRVSTLGWSAGRAAP